MAKSSVSVGFALVRRGASARIVVLVCLRGVGEYPGGILSSLSRASSGYGVERASVGFIIGIPLVLETYSFVANLVAATGLKCANVSLSRLSQFCLGSPWRLLSSSIFLRFSWAIFFIFATSLSRQVSTDEARDSKWLSGTS